MQDSQFKLFRDELEFIVKEYMLDLLGITNKKINLSSDEEIENIETTGIIYKDRKIYFTIVKSQKFSVNVAVSNVYDGLSFKDEESIFNTIIDNSIFNPKFNRYKDIAQQRLNYKYAIQVGICKAITSVSKTCYEYMNRLLIKLEEWSSKTYEGKKVPFAFVIDPVTKLEENRLDYLEFLELDFSATISDGISSIVELDRECRFIGYKSICKSDLSEIIGACGDISAVPLRFAEIITNYIDMAKVGIFLLINGDIILAKERKILYVKRNGKWINFSQNRFVKALSDIVDDFFVSEEKSKEKLEFFNQIYASVLDVSFSHTGGIIAYVDSNRILNKKSNKVLNFMDRFDCFIEECKHDKESLKNHYMDLCKATFNEALNKELSNDKLQELTKNFDKMYLKRKAISSLCGEDECEFASIDRRLRCELIGLDGATIINLDGRVMAFGAIIQNDSGSTGGGRGAAASKLSDFGGFAIKISTDGYIEIYSKRNLVYKVK